MHAAIVVRGNSRKHGRCAVRALADERRTGKARHHVGPRIAGHAERGGEHHAPDPSVGMTVPHGGEPAPSEATKRTSRFRLRAHLRDARHELPPVHVRHSVSRRRCPSRIDARIFERNNPSR